VLDDRKPSTVKLKNSPQGFCYNYCKCLHFCWLLY